MKRIGLLLLMTFLMGSLSFATSAEGYDFDLSKMSLEELEDFESDVNSAIKEYHKPTSKEESAVLDAVKEEVEGYFSEGKVSWPWFDYSYTKEWDFYTVSTHMDYKEGDESSERFDIYGELYYNDGYVIYFLEAGHDRIIDKQDSVPQERWMELPDPLINSTTGLDLALLGENELNNLNSEIENEISDNHTTDSSTKNLVLSLVKEQVEQNYNEPNWPWINYSYTNDWDLYTLETSVNYKDANDEKQKADVYAEAYPTDGDYELYYLTVGDDVLIDKREELPANLSYPGTIKNTKGHDELTEPTEPIETETEELGTEGTDLTETEEPETEETETEIETKMEIQAEEDRTVYAPDNFLTGMVIEATMNTITVQTEDGAKYICSTEDTEFDLVNGGIMLGMEVEVALDSTTSNEYGLFAAETVREITETEEETEAEEEETEEKTSEEILSYNEYMAADMDTLVSIESYVQAKQLNKNRTATLYTQDQDGAYFIFDVPCSRKEYNSLKIGNKVRITGYKSEWSKEVEIDGETLEIIDDGDTFIAEPLEVADLLDSENLINYQNQYVSFTSMTIEPVKDKHGNEVAFLYGYNGSGSEGDDLYFNASYNGNTYNFLVESDLCDSTTDVYQKVTNLGIGDCVDIYGFLSWNLDEDVNPYVTGLDVVTNAEVEQINEATEAKEESPFENVEESVSEVETEKMTETLSESEKEDTVLYENGSRGDEVREVQEKLIELGYLSGTADGIFGDMTEAALREFQEEKGLEVTGKITTDTLNTLNVQKVAEVAEEVSSDDTIDGGQGSSYDRAFVRAGAEETSMFFMFDTDNRKAIYFDTLDILVMETEYTGDFSTGVTLDWSAYEEGWIETFIYQEGAKTGTLVDLFGDRYEYEVCGLSRAQRALDKKSGKETNDSSESSKKYAIDEDLVIVYAEKDSKYTTMYNIVFAEYDDQDNIVDLYTFDNCVNPRDMGDNFDVIGGLPSWFYIGATVHVKANKSSTGNLSTKDFDVHPLGAE